MYCRHCGTQIPENGRFCPSCGAPTDNAAGGSTAGTSGSGAQNPGGQGGFQQQWSDLGGGIKDAAENVKDEFEHVGDEWEATGEEFRQNREEFHQNVHDAGARAEQAADDLKKNWREYLTPGNIELVAAIALIFPFALAVISLVVSFVGNLLPLLGFLTGIVSVLLRIVFLICSALGVGAGIYTVAMNAEKQTTWGWIALVGDVVAFVSVLCLVFQWGIAGDILLVIALLYGIVLVGHVLIRGLGIETQPEVAEDLKSYKTFYDNYQATHPNDRQSEEERIANDPQASYFDGTGWSCFGYNLLILFVGGITCGIAMPWMLCKKYKWQKQHTVINGRRLDFNGTGASLLGHWLLWELLTAITCGIYGFFLYVALKKWEMKHTYYADEPLTLQEGTHSTFDGNSFEFFLYELLADLIILVTCCIGLPWALNIIYKWEAKHEVICRDHMRYDGSALGLFMQSIIAILLSLITCGIYASWGEVRIMKYQYRHYRVASQAEIEHDEYYSMDV